MIETSLLDAAAGGGDDNDDDDDDDADNGSHITKR